MSQEQTDVMLLAEELEIDQDLRNYLNDERQMSNVLYTGLSAVSLATRVEPGSFRLRRLGCVSHTLQLVMAQFDKFRVRTSIRNRNQPGNGLNPNPIPPFIKVIIKAKKLVAKFNTSTKATPRLVELSKKKLIGDVTTRWSSTYLLL